MRKQSGWYAPHDISLASCPSGRRAGWAVRRFDSLVLSEVPNVVLCLCSQGEGAFLRIAPYRYKSNEPPAKGHRSAALRFFLSQHDVAVSTKAVGEKCRPVDEMVPLER